MAPFVFAHATSADPRAAFASAARDIDAQRSRSAAGAPTLGWLYLTDLYAGHADSLLDLARKRWPGAGWVGAVGVGICASGVEYFDEPALALMLSELPRSEFRLFSGAAPLPRDGFRPHAALVHADPATPDLAELIGELSARMASGYLFGGLASARITADAAGRAPTLTIADGVFAGGLSGVAFSDAIGLVSRVTQGCQPVGPTRRIDASEGNLVVALDGRPALDALLDDLDIANLEARAALPRLRGTLVGISDGQDDLPRRAGSFGADVRVRHLIGLDPGRRAIAIADTVETGSRLAFCTRNTGAARRDLVRICAEVREEFETAAQELQVLPAGAARPRPEPVPARMAGAIYVSCAGRGGPHFGAPSAELAVLRRELGDVPLVGFFAAGEIGRRHLYGYTGVLTVFGDA